MYRFYCPDIAHKLTLPDDEQRHAVKVLRLKQGDTFEAFDGNGSLFICTIKTIDKKTCTFEIVQTNNTLNQSFKNLHIAIAPTKNNDRLEWFLEKATEIGISQITPILSARSERKIIKPERLEKILVAATKQSQRLFVPKLNPLIDFKTFIGVPHQAKIKAIAHCEDTPKKALKLLYNSPQETLILVGPEGDFTKEEINFAEQYNYKSVSLNSNRLRTETAALVACHTIQMLND